MKSFAVICTALVFFVVLGSGTQAQKARSLRLASTPQGATLTLVASPTVCVSPCAMTYEIYRGASAGAENMTTPVNPTPLTSADLVFTDTTVSFGGTYFYVAQAVETSGTSVAVSANSNEVSGTFLPAPAPPGLAVKFN